MSIGRIVIVPEFQGFGVGIKFINEITNLYKNNNRVRITTSLKPFIEALKKRDEWKCVRFGRVGNLGKSSAIRSKGERSSVSKDRITATFQHKVS